MLQKASQEIASSMMPIRNVPWPCYRNKSN